MQRNLQLPLEAIHPQWHLKAAPSLSLAITDDLSLGYSAKVALRLSTATPAERVILENKLDIVLEGGLPSLSNPIPLVKKRGRPQGSRNKSTKRDKSKFEHVLKEVKKLNHCGGSGEKPTSKCNPEKGEMSDNCLTTCVLLIYSVLIYFYLLTCP